MLFSLLAVAARKQADPSWYDRVDDALPRFSEILTAVLAAIAIAGILRSVYRRTVGRRRDRYGRLRRLGTMAQVSFFSSVLGEPPAMRRTVDADVTEYDERGQASLVPKTFIEWV